MDIVELVVALCASLIGLDMTSRQPSFCHAHTAAVCLCANELFLCVVCRPACVCVCGCDHICECSERLSSVSSALNLTLNSIEQSGR